MSSLRAIHSRERAALCDTLRSLGPDAPTLCDEWTVGQLAAHLVVPEKWAGLPAAALVYPFEWLLPGALARRFRPPLQRVVRRQMASAERRGWPWLLRRLAAGPPAPFRLPWARHLRLVEDWIHHEDMRRANGLGPRAMDAEFDDAIWRAATVVSRFPYVAQGREGLEVATPDGRIHRVADAEPTVRVCGPPGELLLFIAGRIDVAQVTVDADAATLATLVASLRI